MSRYKISAARLSLARSLVAKAEIGEAEFAYTEDSFLRDFVCVRVTAKVAGGARKYAYQLMITEQVYQDEKVRSFVAVKAKVSMREQLIDLLLTNRSIVGPVRRLPK